MNVLFAATECFPFAKVGGLGDVIGTLPKQLNDAKVNCRVIIPKYKTIDPSLLEGIEFVSEYYSFVGTKANKVNLYKLVRDNVTYYFVESEKYFNRERIYNFEDEVERWALFQVSIIEALKLMDDFKVDIIHCHDWHTGMIPQLIKQKYFKEYGHIKTVFTIHNIMYQGIFDRQLSKVFNLPFDSNMDMDGKMNFLKSAIVMSDYVTTVSESYAQELASSDYYSMGLSKLLNQRVKSGTFTGILNGIDYNIFDPKNDEYIPVKYDFKNYRDAKLEAKKVLYQKLGVDFYTNVPMIGIVTRLTRQKGIDLIKEKFEEFCSEYTFKMIVIGSGDLDYEEYFNDLEKRHPFKVKCYFGYNEELAHLVYAASDMFLMPSAFEPCGLGQMIALKYGSLPIVRETGGLKDTVIPYNEYELTGNGFSFTEYNAHDMFYVDTYAFRTYAQTHCWDVLVQNAMSSDYGFDKSVAKYAEMYKKVIK